MYPSGAHPGGTANTALPMGVVQMFSRSAFASRSCIGVNWRDTSAWKEMKTRPDSDTDPGSVEGTS